MQKSGTWWDSIRTVRFVYIETARFTKRTSIGAQRNPASEEAILAAAGAILSEGGLAAFSIEAVARRAKAGKPTIYRWWPSKAALLLDIYHRQKGETFYADTGNTRKDLIAFLETLLGFWQKSGGEVFRSIIAEAQSDPAALEALFSSFCWQRLLTGRLDASQEQLAHLVDAVLIGFSTKESQAQ